MIGKKSLVRGAENNKYCKLHYIFGKYKKCNYNSIKRDCVCIRTGLYGLNAEAFRINRSYNEDIVYRNGKKSGINICVRSC